MTATGWMLETVDALPFPQVLELFKYWADCPPAHLLLRGFVSYKGTRKKELNNYERAAMPPSNVQLPIPPAYVIDAMRSYKPENPDAGR